MAALNKKTLKIAPTNPMVMVPQNIEVSPDLDPEEEEEEDEEEEEEEDEDAEAEAEDIDVEAEEEEDADVAAVDEEEEEEDEEEDEAEEEGEEEGEGEEGEEGEESEESEGVKKKSKKSKSQGPVSAKTKKKNIGLEMLKTQNASISSTMFDDESDEENEEGLANEEENYLQKFDSELRQEFIQNFHPEAKTHNYEEVKALSKVSRDGRGIIIDPLHKTIPFMSKYEITRVIGQRAKQIDSGAKPFVNVPLNVIDGYHIACLELEQKKMPFIIKRPLPNGGIEYWNVNDLEIL